MIESILLCHSVDLLNSGEAVPFDVQYGGQTCRAFAVRYAGQVHAYLNRCTHVPIEMDYQPNRFFDSTGHWLMCATHGAMYSPQTGQCQMGPCRGGLIKIDISERDGVVHWHTAHNLKSLEF
ncbi:MAG: Rieske 2Fe-2S domain-containing protein [Pseudomonadota bacterium]